MAIALRQRVKSLEKARSPSTRALSEGEILMVAESGQVQGIGISDSSMAHYQKEATAITQALRRLLGEDSR